MSVVPEKPPQSLFSRRRIRILYLTGITVLLLLFAYRAREALNPLLLSALIAYILTPVVRYIERRLRLPRTAAILLLYLAFAGLIAAASAYSIGKTLVGVDKVMIRIAGGWQEIPGGPAVPEMTAGGTEPSGPAKRLAGVPVYGDDEIVRTSPALGFIDVNQNGVQDMSEPEFMRESGRWKPTPRFASFVRRVPGYVDEIRNRLRQQIPDVEHAQIEDIGDKLQSGLGAVVTAGGAIWRWMTEQFFGGFATVMLYTLLVPVYTFFLLRGFDSILDRGRALLPGLYRDRIVGIVQRIDRACAAFFRGRFLICIGKGIATWLGLYAVGVEFALPIGIAAGVLSLIPAVGPIVGMILAIICSYGPEGWAARIIGSGIVFGVIEALEAIANPVLLGREVGLHPVTLLVALFLFGDLFGLFGVLLAVPLAAILKILVQEFILPELEHLAAESPQKSEHLSGIMQVFEPSAAEKK